MKKGVKFADVREEILSRLAHGESLRSVCADPKMPVREAVYKHIRSDETFRDEYAEACRTRELAMFDDILAISDRNHPVIVGITEDGCPEAEWPDTKEAISRDRLRIDARKWMLGKMNPTKYGERVTHAAPDGGPAFVVQVPPVETDADEWARKHKK